MEIGDYPEIGRRREELLPGCRIRPVKYHVIYYRIANDVIEIIRILHERKDPALHI
jgi:toxin ParE1/3/4